LRAIDAGLDRDARTSIDQVRNTFPGAACVVALVDRFAQHCHRVEIIGDSYRDKHRLDPDRPKPTSPKSRRKRPWSRRRQITKETFRR